MLPSNFVTFVALGLPPLEIVSGLLVVTGLQIRLGLMTICSSLLIFSLAIFWSRLLARLKFLGRFNPRRATFMRERLPL
jgi:hypothetical protein